MSIKLYLISFSVISCLGVNTYPMEQKPNVRFIFSPRFKELEIARAKLEQSDSLEIVSLLKLEKDGAKRAAIANILLFISAGYGRIKALEALLEEGASLSAVNKQQSTVLHIAAHSGQIEIVEFLLTRSVNVNALDFLGLTPLDYALGVNPSVYLNEGSIGDSFRCNQEICGLLMSHGGLTGVGLSMPAADIDILWSHDFVETLYYSNLGI